MGTMTEVFREHHEMRKELCRCPFSILYGFDNWWEWNYRVRVKKADPFFMNERLFRIMDRRMDAEEREKRLGLWMPSTIKFSWDEIPIWQELDETYYPFRVIHDTSIMLAPMPHVILNAYA